ncbi:MAG: DUF3473 domain-containing protein [Acidobacteria bacterium]|nr:DUF3473 domain-containing protein [Acidobacteriota bacterium]
MIMDQDPINALTVDVEDYYQVESFTDVVPREKWAGWAPRIDRNTDKILSLFDERGVYGTFFILGWVAERNPQIVRRIADAGHEIACHSYGHHLIQNQTQAEFRADLIRAKRLIEDQSGQRVIGYRAPTYSITPRTLWALDILIEEGFQYDSSIFPIYHDRYGMPGAERFPHLIRTVSGEIVEFPPSTLRLAGQNIPLAGGGYFRIMPYRFFSWGVRRINRTEQQSAIFMVHAWEVDEDQPRISGTWLNVWRHRNNLSRTLPRLQRLLSDFNFAPMRDLLRHPKCYFKQQGDLHTQYPVSAVMD